jgi:group II intron reverse transcriptase/maturase
MTEAKPFVIDKHLVMRAWKQVKAKGGGPGVDGKSLEEFAEDLEDNLYKIWNRMSSGSYFPQAVLITPIPKPDGSTRELGIPTIGDRVAQTVVKLVLEPVLEKVFHKNSFGYRPHRSAHDALEQARQQCWQKDWVIDLDIKGFFDNLSHDLILKALRHHRSQRWCEMYVQRWLEAPARYPDGREEGRSSGTPQGGVISPLLANLFLHYGFDQWMQREFPAIVFERYADDILIHAVSLKQAEYILKAVTRRLRACGLELNKSKTRIIYCKDNNRTGDHDQTSFDFLGNTFRRRPAKGRNGALFDSFLPAISDTAVKRIRQVCRSWKLTSMSHVSLDVIAARINPIVRGWINYYGRFYRARLWYALQAVGIHLVLWARRKYKVFRHDAGKARRWLRRIAKRDPQLFAHWATDVFPWSGR